MELTASPEQARWRDDVVDFLVEHCPTTRVRAAEPLGFDADLWDEWRTAGLHRPERPLVDQVLIVEELGAALAPIPYAEAVAVAATGTGVDPGPREIATLVLHPLPADRRARLVPAGAVADTVVGLAGDTLIVDRADPSGRGLPNFACSPVDHRRFDARASRTLRSGTDAVIAHSRAVDTWRVLTAGLLVGIGQRALDLTVAHVKSREQFGTPIGAFQALQHRLADRVTALDGARLLVWRAAWAADVGSPDAPAWAVAAFAFATESARAMTREAMQMHAGRGYTLDHDIQLYHRRAKGWPLLIGDLTTQWELLGERLYQTAPSTDGVDDSPAVSRREGIDFTTGSGAEAFRREVRALLAQHVTDEVQERVRQTGTVHDWELHRAFAAKGWIGISWPVEDGGQGRDPWEVRAFAEECALADAPTDGLSTSTMIANTLRVVGSPEHKARVLPEVLAGEALLCMGYSEPEAGSDVAATRTTAVRDGDDWIINGEKIFTSMAHEAKYVFLLTRTNPDVPKHKGLTMFLVPMDTPGVTVEALHTLGAPGRTNRTFYRDVRVADSWRVGDVDGGWAVMNVALTFERGSTLSAALALRETVAWARSSGRISEPGVRARLARVHVDNEVSALLSVRTTWVAASGALPGVEGAMTKLYSAESMQRATADLLDLVGAEGLLTEEAPDAPAAGTAEQEWRKSAVVTVYGGTSEVMRGIIAERHLGLPRTRK
jgi:3-oxochol-4-en-24-oyl-CoA dehydrogenase